MFEALLTEKDAVFSDELNHASIIDGLRLCKARKHRYRHLDMSGNYIPCRYYDVTRHFILQVSMQCAMYVLQEISSNCNSHWFRTILSPTYCLL